MTELFFVVCLATSPDVCEDQSLQYLNVSPRVCTMQAQPQLARWADEHPGWRVRRWTCRPAGLSHDA